MARFADDPTTANRFVLGPMIGRNGPGIHRHDEGLRFFNSSQQRFHLLHLRREPAVEPNHELCRSAIGVGSLISVSDLLQLACMDC